MPRSDVIATLRGGVSGPVIGPDDPEYDKARTVFYGGFDKRPEAIVRVSDASDAATVISTAADAGVELAVRSGGHSTAGHSTTEGGIVLDLGLLRDLNIDVADRTAWAGSGLTTGEYTAAAAEHGLATGFGDTGSVGIGGLTLGGGVGYLVRKHGLTIDDLLAAEIVTADGRTLVVDDSNEPDLFWAIRGGGGNFGVVTRFRFRLHEVGTVVGGMLLLPASPEAILRFIAEAEAAPEELSAIANVMPAPPMAFLAEEHHGKLVIFALMAFAGPVEDGERAVAPFRSLATPLADMVGPKPYPELFMPVEEDYHPIAAAQTMLVDRIDDEATEAIVDRIQASAAAMSVTQIRILGGAMARVPAEATAFAHRDRRFMVNVGAVYERPEEAAQHEAWVDELTAIIRQDQTGAYVNFLHEEGLERVREAYPGPTWQRLAAIKARYDPTNVFRLNQNIPPAA
ncbi:MAG TPA: FAD-binding oxidoreductase [Actinomycetota bacterium]|nr:FAD-binding oxidoreductase [Actinomycetota bacterium]